MCGELAGDSEDRLKVAGGEIVNTGRSPHGSSIAQSALVNHRRPAVIVVHRGPPGSRCSASLGSCSTCFRRATPRWCPTCAARRAMARVTRCWTTRTSAAARSPRRRHPPRPDHDRLQVRRDGEDARAHPARPRRRPHRRAGQPPRIDRRASRRAVRAQRRRGLQAEGRDDACGVLPRRPSQRLPHPLGPRRRCSRSCCCGERRRGAAQVDRQRGTPGSNRVRWHRCCCIPLPSARALEGAEPPRPSRQPSHSRRG